MVLTAFAAVVGLIARQKPQNWFAASDEEAAPITATVQRVSMPVTVRAGGELENSESVEVTCEVEGQQLKIVKMLPEGAYVKEGDVVLWIDPSEINDRLAEQEIKLMRAEATAKAAAEELKIQENLAASTVARAELALMLAELDQKKYAEGDYQVELKNLQGAIALAEADLQEAQDAVEHNEMLVKKGFRTPEQLRAKEQAVRRAEYNLSRDQDKLRVLQEFAYKRQTAELTSKAEEAKRELERAKSSSAAAIAKAQTDAETAAKMAALERGKLDKLNQQRALCQAKAPQEGTIVYAKDKGKRIELGASIHYKQRLFSLSETSKMQVRAFVHESVLKKVQPGQPASIRIDAYPDKVLKGRVTSVDSFYDSTRHWLSGGVKEYAATVAIDEMAISGPKPGMTAQVEILVGALSDALVVPIQAVAEQKGNYFCYVANGQGVDRRRVTIGQATENYVHITDGLAEGEKVALDARSRAEELDVQDSQTGEPISPDSSLASGI